ncbi:MULTISPECIES: hypothetical protein [Synergistaceae]|nr:hypothetical protein [Synergistaceae bacterium DZ-S4]
MCSRDRLVKYGEVRHGDAARSGDFIAAKQSESGYEEPRTN